MALHHWKGCGNGGCTEARRAICSAEIWLHGPRDPASTRKSSLELACLLMWAEWPLPGNKGSCVRSSAVAVPRWVPKDVLGLLI